MNGLAQENELGVGGQPGALSVEHVDQLLEQTLHR